MPHRIQEVSVGGSKTWCGKTGNIEASKALHVKEY